MSGVARRLIAQGGALLRQAGAATTSGSASRAANYSSLPEDLAAAAAKARFPARRTLQPSGAAAAEAAAAAPSPAAVAAAATAADATAAATAQVRTPWMLPWEKRQLQGGDLRWWEKVYWGVFVVGIALILFNRIEWEKAPDPAIEERKKRLEGERREAARLVLAGKSVLVPWGTDDPFQGMTPQEIEAFCKAETGGASEADPFEGLSPEEIDEYIAKHGLPQTSGAQL